MNKAPVTFLMTVHNGMPYLPETVATCMAQSFEDFRFIIIDNASTDGTADFLASIKDKRVSLGVEPKAGGRTAALNRGLAEVETEFTAVIDADDLAGPSRLKRQVAFLRERPEVAMVGSDIFYIDRQSEAIGNQRYPTNHGTLLTNLPLFNQFAHSACTFRTAEARAVGGYPEDYAYAQDFGLWLALLKRGCRVASIPEYLASIRVHPTQTSRDAAWLERRIKDELKLDKAMLDLVDMPPWSRQTARLRLALTLRGMGRNSEAKEEFARCFREAPLFFFNPLLRKRLFHSVKRSLFPMKVS